MCYWHICHISVCSVQIFYLEYNDGHINTQYAVGSWKGIQPFLSVFNKLFYIDQFINILSNVYGCKTCLSLRCVLKLTSSNIV